MRKIMLPGLAAILGLALVAVACGDDGNGGGGGTNQTTASTSTVAPASTATAAATPAAAPATVKAMDNPSLGKILADAQGRTLYIFKRDQPGTSNCYDQCAQTWPVLTITSGTPRGEGVRAQLSTTDRRDGTKQVTYDGMPLYYFASDSAPGDTKGQGVGNVWFVIEVKDGSSTGAASPSGAGSSTVATSDSY